MDTGYAVVKGIIQGLTEFLPVSSTAHLIFTDALSKLFGWTSHTPLPGEEEFFDIMLHLGTLLAVVVYFRSELTQMVLAILGKGDEAKNNFGSLNLKQVPLFLVVSMICTIVLILGVVHGSEILWEKMGWTTDYVHDISEFYLHNPQWVAGHLLLTGCLLFFTESWSEKRQQAGKTFAFPNALMMGIAQGCAGILHGVSRSGSTISAGLASGLDRLTATRYSFLLSIPTFLAAAVYESLKIAKLGIGEHLNWPAMAIGTIASAVVGYFCVKYFIQFVARHSLKGFAIYCWVVGLGMLALFSV